MLDQGVSSGTNFALMLLAARFLSSTDLGALSLAFSTFIVSASLNQAIVGIPMTARFATVGIDRSPYIRHALGASLLAGTVLSLVILAAALLARHSPLGTPLILIGAGMPFLLLQDSLRFAFAVEGRMGAALCNDLAWALGQVLGTVALSQVAQAAAVVQVLGGWIMGGIVAALLGVWQTNTGLPKVIQSWWWRRHWDLLPMYAAQNLVVRAAPQLTQVIIATLVGFAVLGRVRAVQVLLSPLNFVYLGALFVAVPEAARRLSKGHGTFPNGALNVSALCSGIAAAWVGALFIASPTARSLLGRSGRDVSAILVIGLGVQTILIGSSIGPQVLLRAGGAAAAGLIAELIHATAQVLLMVLCLTLTSADVAIAWAAAISSAIGAAAWVAALRTRFSKPPFGQEHGRGVL